MLFNNIFFKTSSDRVADTASAVTGDLPLVAQTRGRGAERGVIYSIVRMPDSPTRDSDLGS